MKSLKSFLTTVFCTLLLVSPALAADGQPLAGVKDLFDKGGWVMIVIVGLSVVGVAFALERLVGLRRSRLVPETIRTAVATATSHGSVENLRTLVNVENTPLARIIAIGLKRAHAGVSEMERAMEAQGILESSRLQRPIRPIGVLAQVEPLLGLLGTILGMITTFNLLHTTSAAERVSKLAPGIGQALYTTAAGLAIAIPFVLIHHHLQGRVIKAAEEWSVIGTDLVELVHQVGKGVEPKATPSQNPKPKEQAAQA